MHVSLLLSVIVSFPVMQLFPSVGSVLAEHLGGEAIVAKVGSGTAKGLRNEDTFLMS